MKNLVEKIARLCHEANKSYCESIGDTSQVSWEFAPEWQKESARKGVEYHIKNPDSTASDSHNSWLKEKEETGWKYGPVKDENKKEHPCFVPYEKLPEKEKTKDYIFCNIVKGFMADKTFEINKEEDDIIANKTLRMDMDLILQNLKKCPKSRERSLAITKLQEAIMWLGMDLKRLNEPNPYPDSYNPNNTKIEPTADNLKF